MTYGRFFDFPAPLFHYILVVVIIAIAAAAEWLILAACRDQLTQDYEGRIAAALSAAVRTRDPRSYGRER